MRSAADVLALAAAIGCGLSGGVFFAFSTFVMPALGKLPAAQGIAAMQAINVDAINAPFMGALFGSGLVALALAARALVRREEAGASLFVAAALVYLAATLLVTIAANVPLNEALAAAAPETEAASALWTRYLAEWTAWNHVRTCGAAIAAALLVLALVARARTFPSETRALPAARAVAFVAR